MRSLMTSAGAQAVSFSRWQLSATLEDRCQDDRSSGIAGTKLGILSPPAIWLKPTFLVGKEGNLIESGDALSSSAAKTKSIK